MWNFKHNEILKTVMGEKHHCLEKNKNYKIMKTSVAIDTIGYQNNIFQVPKENNSYF